MKKIVKILIILCILMLCAFTSAYFYLRVKGKDLIVQNIEQHIGKKVSFGAVRFSYPLTVKIENISVEGYGSAKEAVFSLSLPYLFVGKVHFVQISIIEPFILINRQSGERSLWNLSPKEPQAPPEKNAPMPLKKNPVITLFAQKIAIVNGTLEVFENNGNQTNRLLQVKKIYADADRLHFPIERPMRTNFNLKAFVSGFGDRFFNEELRFSGWADLYQKDMLAKLTLAGANGQVGLKADLASVKNDMTVKGSMSLTFSTKTSSDKDAKNVQGLVAQALQASGANIDMHFQFKTAMDDFKVGKISLTGEVNKIPAP